MTTDPSLWRGVETADVSQMFATSTWVIVHTTDGRVTEGMPYFTGAPGHYIWITARGENCRGSDDSARYLADSVTHWMPLPEAPK